MLKWKHLSGVLVLGLSALGIARAQDKTCWLRDGTAPAPSLVYLLCEQGAFLVTSDGGTTWASHDIKANGGHLRNIDFLDASHGFAVGDEGLLMATSDAGKTWEARKTDLKENYYGPCPRIIVSLRGGSPEVRVWQLDEDSFHELPWRIVEPEVICKDA